MKRILTMALLVVALAAVGCEGDDGTDGVSSQESGSPTPAPSIAPDIDPGIVTAEPDLVEDFSSGPSGWRGGALRNGGYATAVPRGEDLGFAIAPERISPGTTGIFLQVRIDMPEQGKAGVFCRRSPDGRGGYVVSIDPNGAWEVLRLERDEPERVRGEAFSPGVVQRGRPALMRLLCGTGAPGEPVTIAFTVNSSGLIGARDEQALPVADTVTAGVVVQGRRARASFDEVSLTLGD